MDLVNIPAARLSPTEVAADPGFTVTTISLAFTTTPVMKLPVVVTKSVRGPVVPVTTALSAWVAAVEPTEARVTALLDEVARAGATLLVATHKTGLLPMLGRLVVLHGGRVVLDGPRGAVLERLQGRPAAAAPQGSAA